MTQQHSPSGHEAGRQWARIRTAHCTARPGARPGEHLGRPRNPAVKVARLAWLEFEKPGLEQAERFLTDFGFTVTDRTPERYRCAAGGRAQPAW